MRVTHSRYLRVSDHKTCPPRPPATGPLVYFRTWHADVRRMKSIFPSWEVPRKGTDKAREKFVGFVFSREAPKVHVRCAKFVFAL